MQNPPMSPSDFEEQIRRGVTLEKLHAALTNWITVSDKELEDEYRRRNEKVKLAVVSFPADKFREGIEATDAELNTYYEAHKNELKIPEKRKVKYALVDMQAIRETTQVSAEDIQRYYEDNQQQYSTPEQVRASHILLKTEGERRRDGKEAGRGSARQGQGGSRFRGARDEVFRRRREQGQGGRPRLLPQGPDGAGVRQGCVLDEARRDQRSGQDAVRLPHHQGHR